MKHVARRKEWDPGYIDANLDFMTCYSHYNHLLLNFDAQVACVADVVEWQSSFMRHFKMTDFNADVFVRPVNDDKAFTGFVTTWAKLHEWLTRVIALGGERSSFATITQDTVICLSSPKTIYSEYRFQVVKGEVLSGSLYKQGNRVIYSALIDPMLEDFAQRCVDRWTPNEAFVMDIAVLPDNELKIIELNSINSAGFYACDMSKFVHAIESLS